MSTSVRTSGTPAIGTASQESATPPRGASARGQRRRHASIQRSQKEHGWARRDSPGAFPGDNTHHAHHSRTHCQHNVQRIVQFLKHPRAACGSLSSSLHDLGSVQADAVHYHRFPAGKIKVIQQLMVTKTNVCPHVKAGCVIASINHLGIYGLMIPVENLGSAAAAAASTQDTSWVEAIKNQDVIGMCSMRENMNYLYATRGKQPNFPTTATPAFNPDAGFIYHDHSQPLASDAQQMLERMPGVPSIISLESPAPPQWNRLNDQSVQMLNAAQQQPTQYVQTSPTPMITTTSQPTQSTQMLSVPPGVMQQTQSWNRDEDIGA
eukprot:979103-Amphidinium_carterae.5